MFCDLNKYICAETVFFAIITKFGKFCIDSSTQASKSYSKYFCAWAPAGRLKHSQEEANQRNRMLSGHTDCLPDVRRL